MCGALKEPVIRPHGSRRRALIGFGVLVVGVVAYYTHDVLRARAETPSLFRKALAADSIVLSPEDLSPAQLDAILAVQQDTHFFEHRGSNFPGGTRTTINVLPLGFVGDNFVEGLAEGAEVYHSKPFGELNYDEFLSLLVFDRPMRLNPFVDPEGNARRVRQIKRLLAGQCEPPGLFNRTPNCWTEDPE